MSFTGIILIAAAAGASTPDCDNALTQTDMNICAQREYAKADEALNRQWKRTAAQMKERDAGYPVDDGRPGYFDALLKAQRAWIAWRDAHCITEGYYARGGSLEPLLISTCKTKLTRDRTQQLQFLIEQ
jgi:uncharacterized protein YecT (DUF1311 family)